MSATRSRLLQSRRLAFCGASEVRQRGFTLLEILVTLVIVSLGLLGAAGMQMRMIGEDQEGFQRAQALLLLDDIQNRMAANRADAASYASATERGTEDPTDCTAPDTITKRDLCEWSDALRGGIEKIDADDVGTILAGRGCIEQIDVAPLTFRITVVWQGMTPSAAPVLTCGKNKYGDDALRRAVSTRVAFGVLG
ncbi:MAG: prepilin-type N-terminal cleavage/methylation domain-containing protein [Burkholderiaceae bacterium]|nr:prepilin-type N-terminal cleavage/methylation domain-containing protein [Burkholderiaceae bacterium]